MADHLVQLVRSFCCAPDVERRFAMFEEIESRVGPRLYGYLSQKCPASDVNDVYQETLIAIQADLCRFKEDTDAQLWGWCFRILIRRLADFLRHRAREKEIALNYENLGLAVSLSAEERPIFACERIDLETAMTILKGADADCADYLFKRFILDLHPATMGETYGLTLPAMRRRIDRCLELARQVLKDR